MSTESADYREGFAAGRDDARAQMDALYDQNYQLESELNQLRARDQHLEASLVLVEDQRDKASKERDDVQRLSIERAAEYMMMLGKIDAGVDAVIAQRDAAIAERDAALADLKLERQQHASTREMLRALERGTT